MTVFASYDSAANVDSLKAVARGWHSRGRAEIFAHFGRFRESSEARLGLWRAVVDFIHEDPKLSAWANAGAHCLPAFDLGAFSLASSASLYRFPDHPGDLATFLADRRRFGLVAFSPDSVYALDPFQGIEIEADSSAGYDADTGYATYDLRRATRLHYSVGTADDIEAGAWMNDSTFVMVGSTRLDHPAARAGQWVTGTPLCVWVGDVKTERISTFLGPLTPPLDLMQGCSALADLKSTLYPAVKWQE